jgi:hypothetical protein
MLMKYETALLPHTSTTVTPEQFEQNKAGDHIANR